MKYLVIGAGGTGGCIAAFMTEAGKDVTAIDRGEHLEAIRRQGLRMETTRKGNYVVDSLRIAVMEDYREQPDVIFVCVKGYSLEETIPFIRKIAGPDTVVIPLLNIYGTGGLMQAQLPAVLVTDGCIYISAEIKAPGIIMMSGDIFRVVFGVREPAEYRPVLNQVAADLKDSGITVVLSDNIRRDALQKFAYVSPMAACGAYYDVDAGAAQQPGPVRDTFVALMQEVQALATAMGISFKVDVVAANLAILDHLLPNASTSMQRDMRQGKQSELDGLVFEVVRMGKKHGVPVPTYQMIAEHFGYRGDELT